MNLVLLSSIATGIAVFGLLMAIFDPWLFPPQPKLDAVRASDLLLGRDEWGARYPDTFANTIARAAGKSRLKVEIPVSKLRRSIVAMSCSPESAGRAEASSSDCRRDWSAATASRARRWPR